MLSLLTACLLTMGATLAPPPGIAPAATAALVGADAADLTAGPALERGAARPGGESAAGDFRVVLTATAVSGESAAGDFHISPGLDPAGDSTSPIFADGFESGTFIEWSLAVGATS